jgi:hypothetical protein
LPLTDRLRFDPAFYHRSRIGERIQAKYFWFFDNEFNERGDLYQTNNQRNRRGNQQTNIGSRYPHFYLISFLKHSATRSASTSFEKMEFRAE